MEEETIKNCHLIDPTLCPYCQSKEIEVKKAQVDEEHARREMECPECKRTWTEIYKLVK